MTRRERWLFGAALAPAVLGGLAWLAVFRFDLFNDSLVYSRISLSVLFWWAGLVLSGCLLAVAIAGSLAARRGRVEAARIEAAAAAERLRFLRRLDHELKNPLTALQVETANLEAQLTANGETARALENLKLQTSRLTEMVLQLRKLAQFETRPLEYSEVDLDALLNDLVAEIQLSPDGIRRRITLNLPEVPWPLPAVRGDADLLYLAFQNVLGNAVKFTGEGDAVQVRAYEDDRQVVIEVADTGPGIPADEQPHVWSELYRGAAAHGTPGSGIGLALVKVIVDRHGGTVSLRSRRERGTVVILRLPVGR